MRCAARACGCDEIREKTDVRLRASGKRWNFSLGLQICASAMVISQYSSYAPGNSRLRSRHPDAVLDEVVVRLRSLHRGMA